MTGVLRRALVVAVLLAAIVALFLASQTRGLTPQQRAHRLDTELRCPVCQGLSVADSPSSTSAAIAADVQRRVLAGESDAEVKAAYVARYGSWILLDPSGRTGRLAWAIPLVVVLGAAGGVGFALRRWSTQRGREPSAADLEVVAAIRRRSTRTSMEASP